MNREDIIRMAREAGWDDHHAQFDTRIECFAALVASAERESLRESFRVVTAAEASAAILHEREACAKLIETSDLGGISSDPKLQNFIAALLFGYAQAIRARGQA